MEMPQGQVLLMLLLSSVLLVQKVSSAPSRDVLRGELIRDNDVTHLILVEFLSELMAMKEENVNPINPELEEQYGIRETVMRRHLPLTQRERKAGCRNFFWKTFTSC